MKKLLIFIQLILHIAVTKCTKFDSNINRMKVRRPPPFPSMSFRPPNGQLPLEFNSADAWPQCRQIIEYIDNQFTTGSCYYVHLTHVLADRICIETKGKVMVSLSAWDLMSCCPNKTKIFEYLVKQGIRTGGSLLHTDPGCRPFEAERCTFTSIRQKENGFSSACLKNNSTATLCSISCMARLSLDCNVKCSYVRQNDIIDRNELRFYANGSKEYLFNGVLVIPGPEIEEEMMKEIMANGPIVVLMSNIFPNYSGGIIGSAPDDLKNQLDHAVRIIGWSHLNGSRHWIVANSYGKEFGENGWFRIEMRRNLANIERLIIAPRPDLRRLPNEIKKHGYRMDLTPIKHRPALDQTRLKSFNTLINWLGLE